MSDLTPAPNGYVVVALDPHPAPGKVITRFAGINQDPPRPIKTRANADYGMALLQTTAWETKRSFDNKQIEYVLCEYVPGKTATEHLENHVISDSNDDA